MKLIGFCTSKRAVRAWYINVISTIAAMPNNVPFTFGGGSRCSPPFLPQGSQSCTLFGTSLRVASPCFEEAFCFFFGAELRYCVCCRISASLSMNRTSSDSSEFSACSAMLLCSKSKSTLDAEKGNAQGLFGLIPAAGGSATGLNPSLSSRCQHAFDLPPMLQIR